jgi:hypothetical protein
MVGRQECALETIERKYAMPTRTQSARHHAVWFVSLIAILLLTLFSGATPAVAANLVVNGNFESGNISPWTTSIGGGSATINSNLSFVHAGTLSGQVTSGTTAGSSSGIGGGGSCSGGVRLSVNPSTSYAWSGFILVPSGTSLSSARIRVAWYASPNCSGGAQLSTSDSTTVTTASGTWVQVTGTATSPSTAAFAEVRLLAAPSVSASIVVYFDDITLD